MAERWAGGCCTRDHLPPSPLCDVVCHSFRLVTALATSTPIPVLETIYCLLTAPLYCTVQTAVHRQHVTTCEPAVRSWLSAEPDQDLPRAYIPTSHVSA